MRYNPGRNQKLSEEPKLVKKNVNRSLQKLEKARRSGLTNEEASKGALKPERKEKASEGASKQEERETGVLDQRH